ncbi:hypothetical protein AHiyo4_21200 [Arthrobacter sp. Hiyo4]|nr:hypothetical protein AHiyo4_21200 [Arthrobacter sp. Hiyo4]
MSEPPPIHYCAPSLHPYEKSPFMTSTTTSEHTAEKVGDETAPLIANPAILGIPMFVVGSTALGLQQIGFVPRPRPEHR